MKQTALAIVTAALFVGCSSSPDVGANDADPDEVSRITSALEEAEGGFTSGDEAPDFGDPDITSLVGFEPRFADGQDYLALAPAASRTFRVALLWGHFPAATDGTDAAPVPQKMDWSGTITVDRGAIGLSETLRFDDKDEVAPRTDPKTIAFTSRTYPAVDGLLLRVAVPADATVLHVRTATVSTDIDLAGSARDVGGVVRVPDGRNALAWVAFPEVAACTSGFVLGHWGKLAPGVGKLKASVLDADGKRIGRAKGIWGYSKKQDKKLFFGKVIGEGGKNVGLFGGTYADGAFRGLWGGRADDDGGGLRGFYSDGYDKTDAKGVWLGRYVGCGR